MNLRFELSLEQKLLQESLRRHFKASGGLDRTRVFIANQELIAQDLVDGLARLGVFGIIIDEVHGGGGLTLLDAALAVEMLGYNAAPVPFVASSVIAPLALLRSGDEAQKRRWLPELASGTKIAGAAVSELAGARDGVRIEAHGSKLYGHALFVIDFEADLYVVADGMGKIYLVEADASGLERRRLGTIDQTRSIGELIFDAVEAEPLARNDKFLPRSLIDAGRVMIAADMLGAAQSMLDQAVAYSKVREQFGRPIASFQAVKHLCAEMAAALEPCRSLLWYAGHALDAMPEDASVIACHAKAHISEVSTFVARRAIEVHGGIGFTDLVGLHYWFKRIGLSRQLLGGPQLVRADAARLQGLC